MPYVIDIVVDKTNIKEMKSMLTRYIANENVRADMLQEIVGLLQALTEEAPETSYIARLVNTGIGRIEVFCKFSATCLSDIPYVKRREEKSQPNLRRYQSCSFKVCYKKLTNRGAC
jgi:hypothetical protein